MKYSLLIASLLGLVPIAAQVSINEVCANNFESLSDNNGAFPDWIELYNSSSSPINLTGYYLSDDSEDLFAWALSDLEIPANGFLILFASGVESSDIHLPFKISQEGEGLFFLNPAREVINSLLIPELSPDQSYGRISDGGNTWGLFSTVTPNFSNEDSYGQAFSIPPDFINSQQFFDSQATIKLECPEMDCQIYYSLDGTKVTTSSLMYTGPIEVDSTVVVRAISKTSGGLPSIEILRTFFVGINHSLPIVSLITDPSYLWDWENGIFQEGPDANSEYPFWGANFWKDIQIPVVAEFFEGDQKLGLQSWFDAEVHGGRAARTKPMKPLRLTADKKYGTNAIHYPFFEDRSNEVYRRVLLRNASGDYNNGHLRDAFLQRYFMKEGIDVELLAYQPKVVYINGAYWGVMNLREKIDRFYLAGNYGVDPNNLDLLEEDSIVIEGDFSHFNLMYNFIIDHSMTDQSNFEQAASLLDVNNLADYVIVQTVVNNTNSFHGNIKYWRERNTDSKWRYILFDLDVALARHGWTVAQVNSFGDKMTEYDGANPHINIFYALLKNEAFKIYFINRYADLLNTVFRPVNFIAELNRSAGIIDEEMPAHFERWGWPGYEIWSTNRLATIQDYMEERPAYARAYVEQFFKLEGQFELELDVYPPEAGTIKINTLSLDELPWDGYYFQGVPVEIEVLPNPGYTFSHWESLNKVFYTKSTLKLNEEFYQDDALVAWFGPKNVELNFELLYNPVEGPAQYQFVLDHRQEVELKLYTVDGRMIKRTGKLLFGAGAHQEVFDTGNLASGAYILQLHYSSGMESLKMIIQ